MPASLVPFVEIDGVAGLKRLHHLGEIPLGGLQEKMHVVGKKTVSEKIDSFLLAIKGELLQIPFSVVIVAEDYCAVVASQDDVIAGAGIFDPNGSCHAGYV
jgi:hypothetical protein